MSSFYGLTSCMKIFFLHIIIVFHMHSWMLWTKIWILSLWEKIEDHDTEWDYKQMLKWSNNARYCNTYCLLLLTDLSSQGHLFCLSLFLYFRTYTHTCTNIKTCAVIGDTIFSPSTIKNVPLVGHFHTQTCTKVNKALKTRGITG